MSMTRRDLLSRSITAGAGVMFFGSGAQASPNERVHLGLIGSGGRGGKLVESFAKVPGVTWGGFCDVDRDRVDQLADAYGVEERCTDYRELLERSDLDAVVIATCNHWHCLAAIHACQAGKHVYVEKPLGHDLWQQRQLINAARKNDRVVQVGTQQRSDPMQDDVRGFLHVERGIGDLSGAAACRLGPRLPIGKRPAPLAAPPSVDRDRWLGPAQERPIYRDKWHYDWHWDWNTGNGEMGNWGVHILDDVRNVVLNDSINLPSRVASLGGRALWDDAGSTPNVHLSVFETDSLPITCLVSNLAAPKGSNRPRLGGIATGYVVYGEGGRLEGRRGNAIAYDTDGKPIRKFVGDSGQDRHCSNFIDAVRTGERSGLNCDVEVGHYSSAWCHLANAAYLSGKPASEGPGAETLSDSPLWKRSLGLARTHLASLGLDLDSAPMTVSELLEVDEKRETFADDVNANAGQSIRRTYRAGYEVPTV